MLNGEVISETFLLKSKEHGLCTLLRSLSKDIPVSSWWSVTTITFGQPMMNIQHFSSAQAIAAASPLMNAYQCSASVQNLLPANTMHHPSGQHSEVFWVRHMQCFCNRRKPMPSLFQSGLVSLFNGISTFVGYLMPKLFS